MHENQNENKLLNNINQQQKNKKRSFGVFENNNHTHEHPVNDGLFKNDLFSVKQGLRNISEPTENKYKN